MGKYFSLEEMIYSSTGKSKGISNVPDCVARGCLELLVSEVLDRVRERWGSAIVVNSGFRCRELNRLVGGSPTSQHMRGEAADISAGSVEANRKLFELMCCMQAGGELSFDQLIDERGFRWLHVSYKKSGNRNQILHL